MRLAQDGDFDLIGDAFEADVYGSSRGAMRLAVLWDDLERTVPRLSHGPLRVLDAGGGAGHLAIRLAGLGHHVTLAEPSHVMRERASTAINAADLSGSVVVVPYALQDLPDALHDTFDLVVCHAVLEWLAEPRAALEGLPPLLAPHGQLSLLFYNRNASILKRALRGEFAAAAQELDGAVEARGWGSGCVPLDPEDVEAWLGEAGLSIESRAGIRIFHDHIAEDVRHRAGYDELLRLEKACSRREPFASLAQHIHLVCCRASSA